MTTQTSEKIKGFDEVRVIVHIGKSEYEVAKVRFPFSWILEGDETVVVEFFNGKGKDMTPIKVGAVRAEL